MKLVLATHNNDKIHEIKSFLTDLRVEIMTYHDFSKFPEVVEDRNSLEENAEKKARRIWVRYGIPTLADDTGLFVDALDGKPGVFSSRYAGENSTYKENRRKLLGKLKDIPLEKHNACFRTVIIFIDTEGKKTSIFDECKGYIGFEEKGEYGFGYDQIFYLKESGNSFAELNTQEKNEISHRGKALKKFREFLIKNIISKR